MFFGLWSLLSLAGVKPVDVELPQRPSHRLSLLRWPMVQESELEGREGERKREPECEREREREYEREREREREWEWEWGWEREAGRGKEGGRERP